MMHMSAVRLLQIDVVFPVILRLENLASQSTVVLDIRVKLCYVNMVKPQDDLSLGGWCNMAWLHWHSEIKDHCNKKVLGG